MKKKQAIKARDKSKESTDSSKTNRNKERILDYLKDNGRSDCAEIAAYIGLSPARTRVILSKMKEIEALGENKNRVYRLK